jgi:ribosomal-protein-alanine N-acetyltransferase
LLEGKKVNLRVVEKEDLPLLKEWKNNIEFIGEYQSISQETMRDLEKQYDERAEDQWFLIEKKDGTKIGAISYRPVFGTQEIGYAVLPSERGKGYCTEAVQIMVDYLFLSKDIVRIQAHIDARNVASQKVLENAGFQKEGTFRKEYFARGEWRDSCTFSILREEWKGPKILTKSPQKNK